MDKGLFNYEGKLLITYLIDTLAFFDYPIFIGVNSNQQAQKYIDLIDITPITGILIDDYEIIENKERLEKISRVTVDYFSYPFGEYFYPEINLLN